MSEIAFPYGEQAIALFLSEQDALSLLHILVEADLSDAHDTRDVERIRLADRLAHAMDVFDVARRFAS